MFLRPRRHRYAAYTYFFFFFFLGVVTNSILLAPTSQNLWSKSLAGEFFYHFLLSIQAATWGIPIYNMGRFYSYIKNQKAKILTRGYHIFKIQKVQEYLQVQYDTSCARPLNASPPQVNF